jgi:uncharacterized protein YecE (DUF72 family)
MAAALRIGCSSWTSEAWWGRVYPAELPPGDRLALYARHFDAVEVDSSYYRDPGPFLVRRWRQVTPDGFVFTLKVPRELLDPKHGVDREGIAAFESHARELGPKLGALLLQFSPWVKPGRASGFLRELLNALDPSLRYAVELRDAGWFQGSEGATLLRELTARRLALAWSYLTYVEVPAERTTDFVYLRFIADHTSVPAETHGELRVDRSELSQLWADRVRAVAGNVTTVFAFFNNHFAGFAPASVNLFRQQLGLVPVAYEASAQAPQGPPAPRGRQQRID